VVDPREREVFVPGGENGGYKHSLSNRFRMASSPTARGRPENSSSSGNTRLLHRRQVNDSAPTSQLLFATRAVRMFATDATRSAWCSIDAIGFGEAPRDASLGRSSAKRSFRSNHDQRRRRGQTRTFSSAYADARQQPRVPVDGGLLDLLAAATSRDQPRGHEVGRSFRRAGRPRADLTAGTARTSRLVKLAGSFSDRPGGGGGGGGLGDRFFGGVWGGGGRLSPLGGMGALVAVLRDLVAHAAGRPGGLPAVSSTASLRRACGWRCCFAGARRTPKPATARTRRRRDSDCTSQRVGTKLSGAMLALDSFAQRVHLQRSCWLKGSTFGRQRRRAAGDVVLAPNAVRILGSSPRGGEAGRVVGTMGLHAHPGRIAAFSIPLCRRGWAMAACSRGLPRSGWTSGDGSPHDGRRRTQEHARGGRLTELRGGRLRRLAAPLAR